jgi:hypothetical protein
MIDSTPMVFQIASQTIANPQTAIESDLLKDRKPFGSGLATDTKMRGCPESITQKAMREQKP